MDNYAGLYAGVGGKRNPLAEQIVSKACSFSPETELHS